MSHGRADSKTSLNESESGCIFPVKVKVAVCCAKDWSVFVLELFGVTCAAR